MRLCSGIRVCVERHLLKQKSSIRCIATMIFTVASAFRWRPHSARWGDKLEIGARRSVSHPIRWLFAYLEVAMSEFAQSVVGHWALWDIRSLSDEFPFATHHCGGDRSRIILVAIFRRRLCLIRSVRGLMAVSFIVVNPKCGCDSERPDAILFT